LHFFRETSTSPLKVYVSVVNVYDVHVLVVRLQFVAFMAVALMGLQNSEVSSGIEKTENARSYRRGQLSELS
jgi:hypothetical protein